MMRRWLGLLGLCAALGCGEGDDTRTVFFVRILQGNAPGGITRIDIAVAKDGATFMVPIEGAPLELPLTREIKLPSDQRGSVVVTATARNAAGMEVGVARAPGEIVPGETITLELEFGVDRTIPDGGMPMPALLTITPAAADFGLHILGTQATRSFTVQNAGGAGSGVLTVGVSGADVDAFSASGNCAGASLGPGASCDVTITLNPARAGILSASLAVTASPGGTASAALTANAVFGDGLMVSPASSNFGLLPVGGTSAPAVFTLQNSGGAASGTVTVSLAGSGAAEFTLGASTCTGPVPAGGTCTVEVRFRPTTVGSKAASLTLMATPGGTVLAALSGQAVSAPGLSITPTSQALGNVVTGTTASTTFTVQNPGGAATGNLAVAVSGVSASEVTTMGCAGSPLAAGASCTLTVRLAPTTVGSKAATITVSATPGASAAAILSATAVAPGALTITPSSAAFGAALIGQDTAPQSFTVRNTGGAATGVPAVTITGSAAADYRVSANGCSAALAPAATCAISVILRPSAAGGRGATLEVSATPGGLAAASMSGTGQRPAQLMGDAASHDFGTIDVTLQSPPFTWTVRNTGDVSTGTLATSITGASAQYSITNGCTGTLAGGASCTVVLRLAPSAAGTHALSITITASPGGSAALSATGVGRALRRLTVTTGGTGGGSVGSTPAGIACGSDCTEDYVNGTVVTLSPTALASSTFTGWSGDCTGTGACMVTMSAARNVNADFTLRRYTLTVTPPSNGSIATVPPSTLISCPGDCSEDYNHGSPVTLRATASAGYMFGSWGGACAGQAGDCSITMTGAVTVSASFTPVLYPITVAAAGAPGTLVTSAPAGISCPGTCSTSFAYLTPLTLNPSSIANFRSEWVTGPCAGASGPCAFTVTGPVSAQLSFIRQRSLTVRALGGGQLVLDGIDCSTGCTNIYDEGTMVRLTVASAVNARFERWATGGGASCSNASFTCDLTLSGDYSVDGIFSPRLRVRVQPDPVLANIYGLGIDCGGRGSDCEEFYPYGSTLDLRYHLEQPVFQVVGWGDICAPTAVRPFTILPPQQVPPLPCSATLNAPTAVELFTRPAYDVIMRGNAGGLIVDSERNPMDVPETYLLCENDNQFNPLPDRVCTTRFPEGQRWLVAIPRPGFRFVNFDAPCRVRDQDGQGRHYCLLDQVYQDTVIATAIFE